jgi:FKBP-type peptidyl-prolyl cis-trans isomerase FkpA
MRMRRVFRALLCALPLLAACGDSTGPGDPDLSTVEFAPALGVDISAMERVEPGVYIRDVEEGEGEAVAAVGRSLQVRYRGYLANGTEFQNNLAPKPTYGVVLGQRSVIAGWEYGLPGMKVGGKRLLVIPPSLGYGARANGPIPPNSVLVFEVELVSMS